MFTLARQLIRHKVGVVAVVAFAVVMFADDWGEEQPAKPANAWAKAPVDQPGQARQQEGSSITEKLGEVAVAASEVAAEQILGDKDLNPVALGGDAVDNFNNANEAFAKANGNN